MSTLFYGFFNLFQSNNVKKSDQHEGNGEPSNLHEANVEPSDSHEVVKEPSSVKTFQTQMESKLNVFRDMGNRVFDVGHFFTQLFSNFGALHAPFNCGISEMKFISEQKNGLHSTFVFECEMCRVRKQISSSASADEINTLAVAATIDSGLNFTASEELFNKMNTSFVSQINFYNIQPKVEDAIQCCTQEAIEEAAEEEKLLASDNIDIESGCPKVTVIVDGAWSKRSYGTGYNALSGAACIIGARTKKVLFLGVRNKFCSICVQNKKRDIPIAHKCFKNWEGSSTSMESDIILEGFRTSVDSLGLVFDTIVSDGDSSSIRKIIDADPYGIPIKKMFCANHTLRSLIKNLKNIAKRLYSSTRQKVRKYLRDKFLSSLGRIQKGIKAAATYNRNDSGPQTTEERISNLKSDIMNCPYHIFGNHDNCRDYFCSSETESTTILSEMMSCGMFSDLMKYFKITAEKCEGILFGHTTNFAESFNSMIAKLVGGKRTNLIQRRSYEIQAKLAALKKNSQTTSSIYKKLNLNFSTLAKKKNREKNMKKINKISKTRKRVAAEADEDYGLS